MRKLFYLFLTASIACIVSCKKEEQPQPAQPKPNKVFSVFVDSDDITWLGTDSGLFSIKAEILKFHSNDLLNQEIRYISQKTDGSKEILIATNNGVFSLTGSYERPTISTKYTSASDGIHSNIVNTINFDYKHRDWIGTNLGVSYKENTTWVKNIYPQFAQLNISAIAFVGDNYFFSTYGKYLYHGYYNSDIDAITSATLMTGSFNGELTTDTIFCVIGDSKADVWFGSENGLTKTDKKFTHVGDNKFEYFLEGNSVFSVLEAANGNIWAGTPTGAYQLKDGEWIKHTTTNGLAGNIVYSLAKDKTGNVWAGTNNGICKYNGTTWTSY